MKENQNKEYIKLSLLKNLQRLKQQIPFQVERNIKLILVMFIHQEESLVELIMGQ